MKLEFNTVAEGRRKGVKIRVTHKRLSQYFFFNWPWIAAKLNWEELDDFCYIQTDQNSLGVSSRGGITQVEISFDDKHAFGKAYCSPKDNYNRKEGVKLALQRAVEAYNEE